MKKLLFIALVLPFMIVAQSDATRLLNMTEITVKMGHNEQFTEGAKKWKKCYIDNKGMDKYNIWHRVQGTGNVYVLTGWMNKWADMDKKDEASAKCNNIVKESIMPHVESVNYNIAESMPDISTTWDPATTVVWVTYFKVNNSSVFNDVIKETSAAMKKIEGNTRGAWYDLMGGSPDMPSYFVSTPFKDYAALDVDRDGVWEVLEKATNKAKVEEVRANFRSSVDTMWSYIFKLDEDMSYR
ncbi:hypothetical protein [Namhaeicola litoreus]|uniref:NIPSNAP protein n=1 Tax=Namhaeicola litoreus TaxID=1052145 RepID=A0ABW3Y0F0_9FLAO